jgi:ribonucleoside-triphosphate reductase (formate)
MKMKIGGWGLMINKVYKTSCRVAKYIAGVKRAKGPILQSESESTKELNEISISKAELTEVHELGEIHIDDMNYLYSDIIYIKRDIRYLFKGSFNKNHSQLDECDDIACYITRAIKVIQNDPHVDKNFQHFEFLFAQGVSKTYIKRYKANIVKYFHENDIFISNNNVQVVEKVVDETTAQSGFKPSIETHWKYYRLEMDNFLTFVKDRMIIQSAQVFARKWALKEVESETLRSMETFLYTLNDVNKKANIKPPNISINFGTDTSPEGRLVSKYMLLAIEKGLENGEISLFPTPIFKVKAGFSYHQNDPNHDLFQLACRVSSKRLFPNFSFMDAIFNRPYSKKGIESEVSYMGCGTRLLGNCNDDWEKITNETESLSIATINLPRIALMSQGDISTFYTVLDKKMNLAIEELLERTKVNSRKKGKKIHHLSKQGVWKKSDRLIGKDEVSKMIRHENLALGFVGLAEALTALVGKHHGETDEARLLGLNIVKHMRKRVDEASYKYKCPFSLIATPTENISRKFAAMDREIFGVIFGVTDKAYYTDSFHIPVSFPISVFRKIAKEAPYHALTNGGHITYIELDGNSSRNLYTFETVVKAMHDAGIGYGSINHPVDRDTVCGYTGVFEEQCPRCGKMDGEQGIRFERIRRTKGDMLEDLTKCSEAKRIAEQDKITHSLSRINFFI